VAPSRIPKWLLEQLVLGILVVGVGLAAANLARLVAARWRGRGTADPQRVFWSIVFLGSFATVFPRADYPHVTFALPLCLAGLCVFAERLRDETPRPGAGGGRRRIALTGCLVLCAVMVLELGHLTAGLVAGDRVVFTEFPARGMLTTREDAELVRDLRETIRREVPSTASLLIAHPYSCFLYPYAGVRNPARFDYIHEGGLLERSQLERLLSRLESGEIRALLMETAPDGRPRGLLGAHAARSMRLVERTGRFGLYVAREVLRP
jgi:hypothetical protein